MELAAGDRSWLTFIRKSRMSDDRAFEWDDAKAASNFAKHRIRFEVAVRIFSTGRRPILTPPERQMVRYAARS
jgi:hypothetical protein